MKLKLAIIMFFFLNVVTCQLIDARRTSRAQRQKTHSQGLVGCYGSLVYEFWCDLMVGSLGVRPLSPENENFIREQLKEIHFPGADTIRIRRLSQSAIYSGCGPKNAMVVFLGGFWPQYMFVAQEWFDTLSLEQKKFLIAHEAMHIILSHPQKRALLGQLGLYTILALIVGTGRVMAATSFAVGHPWLALGIQAVVPFLSIWTFTAIFAAQCRKHEYEADEYALRITQSLQGGCALLEDLHLFGQHVEEDLPQWPILRWQRQIMRAWFGTHPTCEQRIDRLYEWADMWGWQEKECSASPSSDVLISEACG